MSENDTIVGIDLGTTNSEIAVFMDGKPVLISVEGTPLLPSVVGLDEDGSLMVGKKAANQYILHPERTVRSIKRLMGEQTTVNLGDRTFTPVEISAVILRRLKEEAERYLGHPVHRAVITVPAYFSDAQRTATKEAGEVAGFKVERILNEPTAAALCYASEDSSSRTFLVYDLGGGTFDVSVVRQSGNITEVLASHGNTHLGGDDFDRLVFDRLVRAFKEQNELDPSDEIGARVRLMKAAVSLKEALSTESYVHVSEENLMERDGVLAHLKTELSRREYEEMIESFIEQTKDSVHTALREAGILSRDLDDVILVGGSTRTPLVVEMLSNETGRLPRQDVNPDLAVALGAAIQAGRLSGKKTETILVDVTPFSFGTSYLGILNDESSIYCYKPIINRNTPLPTRQTDVFYTIVPGQQKVDVKIYQGEALDARSNLKVGRFMVEGLDPNADEESPVVFEMRLDLNGILDVKVTEHHTGLSKEVRIEDAFRKMTQEDIQKTRQKIFGDEEETTDQEAAETPAEESDKRIMAAWTKSAALVEKAQKKVLELEGVDREDVEQAASDMRKAMEERNPVKMEKQAEILADMLFYLE